MRRRWAVILGAAAVAAVPGLPGCSRGEPAPAPPAAALAPSAPAAASPASALPAPETLVGVLSRLADPAVPGAEKLNLIEGAKSADAATLDRFTTALKDGGYLPLAFSAADVAWSDRNLGNAAADVNVTTANPDTGGFAFPMEFRPHGDDWQLSHKTAEMLLAFGKAQAGAAPAG